MGQTSHGNDLCAAATSLLGGSQVYAMHAFVQCNLFRWGLDILGLMCVHSPHTFLRRACILLLSRKLVVICAQCASSDFPGWCSGVCCSHGSPSCLAGYISLEQTLRSVCSTFFFFIGWYILIGMPVQAYCNIKYKKFLCGHR